jgi:predicted nucleic acid-binding protein
LRLPDAIIAATAIYHNTELFTLNLKDFRYIPEIKLYPFSEQQSDAAFTAPIVPLK